MQTQSTFTNYGWDFVNIWGINEGVGYPYLLWQTPPVIYVDADATGANNGTSWADAYNYLQDALAAASSGDEIWVAEGMYKPDQGSAITPNDRAATLQLKNGVAIYGGFPPGGGSWEERNPNAYETILSGDINTPGENSDNSYHVVTGSGTDATAVLDGFTITAGNANSGSYPGYMGGGMYNWPGSPTVANCTFSGNSAGHAGGGMCNEYSSPTVSNCTFSRNSAGSCGGGMWNNSGTPTLTNCTFSGNSAGSSGGGMFNTNWTSPTLTNCTFSGNSAGGDGGGMSNNSVSCRLTNCTFSGNRAYDGGGMWNYYSSPRLTNCTFAGNFASNLGGGMYNYYYSSPTLTNCTFSVNSANNEGGGMYNTMDSAPTLANCVLWGNTATNGSQVTLRESSTVSISYCDLQGGRSAIYKDGTSSITWDAGNINADPLFKDADLRLSGGSPCIDAGDNTAVPADTADLDGDGNTTEPIPWDLDGNPRILDGDGDGIAIVDMGAYEEALFRVAIDIKPGSCPNPLNVDTGDVLPVAILGSGDFDVNAVDISSIRLAGVAPIRSSYEDVATPVSDGNECDCTTAGPDGYTDLSLKFKTWEVVEELLTTQGEPVDGEVLVLTLTGVLPDRAIIGADCVVVVGKVPKPRLAKISDIKADGVVNLLDFAVIAQNWLESAAVDD